MVVGAVTVYVDEPAVKVVGLGQTVTKADTVAVVKTTGMVMVAFAVPIGTTGTVGAVGLTDLV